MINIYPAGADEYCRKTATSVKLSLCGESSKNERTLRAYSASKNQLQNLLFIITGSIVFIPASKYFYLRRKNIRINRIVNP
jgi:hypothetical protein